MVTQSLDTLLHGSRAVALHVRASAGQVVAAVSESTGKARAGAWVPAAEMPATRLVVPGLPATPGPRQLFVAVPGTQSARLTLTAVTAKGSYQPTGGTALDIPGGSAVSISLPSLGGVAGALRIASTAPVTASVLMPGGPPGGPGVFTAAVPAIVQQGMVAAAGTGAATTAGLVLSAPWHAALARVTEITGGGTGPAPAAATVAVPAGHSVVVPLRRAGGSGRGAPFAVLITPLPGSGPLYAGRVLARRGVGGALQSVLPVVSALSTVRLPPVRAALITVRP
jgi:hypothetical protein